MEKYIIGLDTYDEDAQAYVLGKITENGSLEIVESETLRQEQFLEEVDKVSQFYNVEIVEPSFSRARSKKRTYGSKKINLSEKFKEQLKNDFIKYINGYETNRL